MIQRPARLRRRRLLPAALAGLLFAGAGCGTLSQGAFGRGVDASEALARADAADREGSAPPVLAQAGWVALLRGNDLARAEDRWRRAVAADPAEPFALLGLGEAARMRLEHGRAAEAYVQLLAARPDHPTAEVAIRHLASVLGVDGKADARAREVLQALLAADEASVPVRWLAREVLAHRLEQEGALEEAAALRAEAGGPAALALVGPFSAHGRLDEAVRFAPETEGRLAERYDTPVGAVHPRVLPAPGGRLDLDGEPGVGDGWYAVADFETPRAGTWVLRWESPSDLRLVVDGRTVLRRDEVRDRPAGEGFVRLELPAGRHRLMARLLRAAGRGALRVALLDAAGRPADVAWHVDGLERPIAAGTPKAAPLETPLQAWTRRQLEEAPGNALASHLGALAAAPAHPREAARLDAVTLETAPESAWAHFLGARLVQQDPEVPRELRTGRAALAADRALTAMPEHAAAAVLLAGLAIEQSRHDDARDLLDAAGDAQAPEVALTRARLLRHQGLPVLARRVLEEAWRAHPQACGLAQAVAEARGVEQDVAGAREAAEALKACGPGGLGAWAEDRAGRGDLDGAIEAYQRRQRLDPAELRIGLRLAQLLAGAERPDEARALLESLHAHWPRAAEVAERLGQLEADLGRRNAAERWRRLALRLDPANLGLRRALAFAQGGELLDWGALDLDAAVRAREAEGRRVATGADTVLVVDHAAVEVADDDPLRPVVLERVQTVTQVLTKRGLDRLGEVSLPEGAEIVALHVRKPDGRVVEPEVIGGAESRVTLRGLAAGDYVVTDYVVSSGPRALSLPGWAASAFYFRVFDTPIERSSFVVRAPEALGLEVDAHNMAAPPVRRADGRLELRHEERDVPAVRSESGSVRGAEYLPWLRVGSGAGPEAYGTVWGDYVSGRNQPTPAIEAFAREALAGQDAADPRSRALAVAEAVSRAVRGETSSTRFSDRAAHALARGRGNRLLATQAALKAAGFEARVALVQPFQANPAPHRFPEGELFTHAVLRVDLGDGRHLWLDQNVRSAPLGLLRPIHAGRPALLFAEPGHPAERVTTPEDARSDEHKDLELRMALDAEGRLEAEGVERYHGFAAAVAREGLAQVSAERRRQVVEASLAESLGQLTLEDLAFVGDDDDAAPGTPFEIRFRVSVERYAHRSGDRLVVPGGSLFPSLLSRRLIRLAERRTPLMLDMESEQRMTVRFELPSGLRLAGGGDGVEVESPFGTYVRTLDETEQGPVLTERLTLALARVPPAGYADLAHFAARVDEAQGREVVFEAQPGSASTARMGR